MCSRSTKLGSRKPSGNTLHYDDALSQILETRNQSIRRTGRNGVNEVSPGYSSLGRVVHGFLAECSEVLHVALLLHAVHDARNGVYYVPEVLFI